MACEEKKPTLLSCVEKPPSAIADGVYLFQTTAGTYVEGAWIDILWPASMLLIASAAWARDRSTAGLEVEGRPLLAVPTACALVSTAIAHQSGSLPNRQQR